MGGAILGRDVGLCRRRSGERELDSGRSSIGQGCGALLEEKEGEGVEGGG